MFFRVDAFIERTLSGNDGLVGEGSSGKWALLLLGFK